MMALGVLAIVILIVMVAPIVIFLKREDYKNLAIYFIAVCVFINADAFIITLIAAIVMLMVGWKALFKDRKIVESANFLFFCFKFSGLGKQGFCRRSYTL